MNLASFMAALAHHWLMRLLPLSAAAVVAFLLQSTLFIALIFAADRLLRRYAASAKVLLWTSAIMLVPLLTLIASETPVADDAVLETGVDAGTYANMIVNLIEVGAAPKPRLHLAAGIFSAPKMLVARIESLLDLRRAHTTRLGGRKIVVSCGMLFIALVVSLQLCPRPVAGAEVDSLRPAGPPATAADWVLIPSGSFVMGATEEQKASVYAAGGSKQWMDFMKPLVESSGPAHEVFLESFYILRKEVTNREYDQFVHATGHQRRVPYPPNVARPTQPAVFVTWNDARSYCAWAGARLPTEAEWEKAARGTQGFVYPWGNAWDADKLQSMDRIARQPLPTIEDWQNWVQQHMRDTPEATTADVGSFPNGASPYGVMDMAGNAWEWVADWFDSGYYANSPRNNPKGPDSGDFRVLRGGAFDTPRVVNFTWLRQTFMAPSDARSVTGFRCAKDAS